MIKSGIRIAVADDDPDILIFLSEILARMGHEVVAAAENGRDLVNLCRTSRPELVITDIMMPELDGIDAAEEICRAGPIPFILISAHHDAKVIERAMKDQIRVYLVKPIEQSHLEPAIALAMRPFDHLFDYS